MTSSGAPTVDSYELLSVLSAGLVIAGGALFYVFGTDGEFILDYPNYDPSFDPIEDAGYRGGLATVGPGDGFAFLHALRDGVFSVDQIEDFIERYGKDRVQPIFLVDFDRALLVTTFFEFALENYVGPDWHTDFGDLFDHVPESIATYWRPAGGWGAT